MAVTCCCLRYTRHDVVAVGKFSLNLLGLPCSSNIPRRLNDLLKTLVTKVRYDTMTYSIHLSLR